MLLRKLSDSMLHETLTRAELTEVMQCIDVTAICLSTCKWPMEGLDLTQQLQAGRLWCRSLSVMTEAYVVHLIHWLQRERYELKEWNIIVRYLEQLSEEELNTEFNYGWTKILKNAKQFS